MTHKELVAHYTRRILDTPNPIDEALLVAEELQAQVDDEDIDMSEKDRDKILYEIRFTVNDEMNRAEDTRQLDEDAIIEALDVLERGQI